MDSVDFWLLNVANSIKSVLLGLILRLHLELHERAFSNSTSIILAMMKRHDESAVEGEYCG